MVIARSVSSFICVVCLVYSLFQQAAAMSRDVHALPIDDPGTIEVDRSTHFKCRWSMTGQCDAKQSIFPSPSSRNRHDLDIHVSEACEFPNPCPHLDCERSSKTYRSKSA
eukprot:GABV01011212.1.p1 GENE.GABV01011212.1~~GABV01011212.1.p1  ORF type:complete len:110 (+),score=17.56 GABV01011212.1:56-385(+)